MKIGLLSDIHCNSEGLEQALERLQQCDMILCAGDAINQYRFSNEVVLRLRATVAGMVLGNHEDVLLGPEGERARERPGIDTSALRWLAEQPHRLRLKADGLTIEMFHGSPWLPYGDYLYPQDARLRRMDELGADVVVYGHTHFQVALQTGGTLVINPGSAGDGRDHRNGKQLSCAVLETRDRSVTFHTYANPLLLNG